MTRQETVAVPAADSRCPGLTAGSMEIAPHDTHAISSRRRCHGPWQACRKRLQPAEPGAPPRRLPQGTLLVERCERTRAWIPETAQRRDGDRGRLMTQYWCPRDARTQLRRRRQPACAVGNASCFAASPSSPLLRLSLHSRIMSAVVFLTGVLGCGKSSVVACLHTGLLPSFIFLEGDAFHPPGNQAKLSRGEPLTDEDREPWLRDIAAACAPHRLCLVTCSALVRCCRSIEPRRCAEDNSLAFIFLLLHPASQKRSYRALLACETPHKRKVFVYLRVADVSRHRTAVQSRVHFVNPSLLDSQFATLEEPATGEGPYDVVVVPTHAPRDQASSATPEDAVRITAEQVFDRLVALGVPLA